MAFTDGLTLATEVRYRIANKLTVTQIGPYLNWALNTIEFAGSYEWDLSGPTSATPANTTGIYNLPADCDIGKIYFFQYTTTDLQVIPRLTPDLVTTPDAPGAGAGRYNSWYATAGNGTNPAVIYFQPGLNPGQTLNLIYHKIVATLDGTNTTHVPWNVPYMDDLLIQKTYADIARIFGWSDWQQEETMALQKLKEATVRFSSNRMLTGLFEQAQSPAGKGA